MSVITVTEQNFETEIMSSEKTVLLDFWASWCGPCRAMAPVIDEIADENDSVRVGKIDVDAQPGLASRFGVMSIPTLVIMKNGEIVHQSAGMRPKEDVLALLNE